MKEERTIDLIAVFYDCLLHWRVAVIALVVGAVLMCGFGYYKSYSDSKKAIEEAKSEQSEDAPALEQAKGLTQTEIATVKSSISQYCYIQELEKYKDTFNFATIDYTKIPTAELVYVVDAGEYVSSCNIAKKYAMYVGTNEYAEYLASTMSNKPMFLGDFVSASVQEVVSGDSDASNRKDTTCLFKIKIQNPNEKMCREIAENTEAFIENISGEIKANATAHSIVKMDDSFTYVSDYNFLNKIKGIEDTYNSYVNSLAKNVDSFNGRMKMYYELGIQGTEVSDLEEKITQDDEAIINQNNEPAPEPEKTPEPEPKGSFSLKYTAIGAVLFVCAYFGCIVLFKYVLNGKIHSSDAVGEIFKVAELGRIDASDDKKKFLGFIDKMIIKIRDRNKRKFTEDEAIDLAASSVKIAAAKNEIGEVVAVGCNMSKIKDVNEKIYNKLKEQQVSVKELDNIIYNPENMSKIPGAKGAIIIEQAEGTLYDEVLKEIEILKSQDINILGIILVA